MTEQQKPVLAVVGPTASGKTALGVQLAKYYQGEVVSADSMQIYQGLDLATAKPTEEEMQGVPHHLISQIPRETPFSVADYVALAKQTIAQVHARGHLPILVGGTGLYVSSLLEMCSFRLGKGILVCGKHSRSLQPNMVRKHCMPDCGNWIRKRQMPFIPIMWYV